MKNLYLTLATLFLFGTTSYAQIGRLPLSPKQTIEQNIAKTDIVIEYSRPSMKGREIFGGLVPFGEYWRTGANRNTTISFSEDVIIDNQRIKKGKYAIFTKPGKSTWEFLLYDDTSNWDVPEKVDTAKVKCTTKVIPKTMNESVKSLIINIGDLDNYQFDLDIRWDKTLVTVPIALTTKETMAKLIDDKLNGPTAGDYYSAAVYQLESEKDFVKGLKWINKAIDTRPEKAWYDYWTKARILVQMDKLSELEKTINSGDKLAKAIDNQYGIEQFEQLRALIKKK